MNSTLQGPQRTIQSVQRAVDILEHLSKSARGLSLSELARQLELPMQTVQSLLRTLISRDLVEQAGRGKPYNLGRGILTLAQQWHQHRDKVELIRDIIERLAGQTQENVLLAELRAGSLYGLINAHSNQPLRVGCESENFHYLHALATGKILLAYLPPEQRRSLIESSALTQVTDHTITDRQKLEKHLDLVRGQGYALSYEESAVGVAALAVPIYEQGRVSAALGVALPILRYDESRHLGLLTSLNKARQEMERRWG